VQELLKDVEPNKQENPRMGYGIANFRKNGKAIMIANNDEQMNKLSTQGSPQETTGANFVVQQQPVGVEQTVGSSQSPVGAKHKLATFASPSAVTTGEKQQHQQRTDEAAVVLESTNKFLSSLSSSGHRKVLPEPKPSTSASLSSVTNPGLGSSLSVSFPDVNLYEMLASIDSRVQKMQDSMVYYRNNPKPSPLQSSPLNPIFSNYLSMIKAQVLNIESIIEAKFSNIEHKFSNIEIEDSIWKKTINWKLEEMSSKVSDGQDKNTNNSNPFDHNSLHKTRTNCPSQMSNL